MMSILLRQETSADHAAVYHLLETAFAEVVESDQGEPELVNRLRHSSAFIPELSIVAEQSDQVVGHILLTKIVIQGESNAVEALALAPVAVLPTVQNQGVGGQLIREAHRRAQMMGYPAIILLGHETYYPRFGYEPTSKFGIRLPFEAPEANCMVLELYEGALTGVRGTVVYDPAFMEA